MREQHTKTRQRRRQRLMKTNKKKKEVFIKFNKLKIFVFKIIIRRTFSYRYVERTLRKESFTLKLCIRMNGGTIP